MWHFQGLTYKSEKAGEECGQETWVSGKGRAPVWPRSREQEPGPAGKSSEIPSNTQGLLETAFRAFGGLGAVYFPEIQTKGPKLNNFQLCSLTQVAHHPLSTMIKRFPRMGNTANQKVLLGATWVCWSWCCGVPEEDQHEPYVQALTASMGQSELT